MTSQQILSEIDTQISAYIERYSVIPNVVLMTWAEFCDLQNGYNDIPLKPLRYSLTVIVAPYISKLSVGRLLLDN